MVNNNVLIKLYQLVLRVIVLVTLVVPLDLVVRVTLVVVFPVFVIFTVLRVIFAIFFLKFLVVNRYVQIHSGIAFIEKQPVIALSKSESILADNID